MIHAAGDDYVAWIHRAPLDLDYLLDRPLARVRPYLADRPELWRELLALAEGLRDRIAGLAPALDRGFCHGDFHPWNVLVAEDARATAIDFDCCGPGWRAFDLASFRWNTRSHAEAPELWTAFLRGYRERRPIGAADLAAAPALAAAREVWLVGNRAAFVTDWGIRGLNERLEQGVDALRRWEALLRESQ